MLFGACDTCNSIYVTAGLALGETICPECGLPLRFIRGADGLDLCRESLALTSAPQRAADPSARRAA